MALAAPLRHLAFTVGANGDESVFTANLAGQSGCATTVTTLQTQPWPQTSEGGEWAPLTGGPETSTGLVINSNGQPTYPIAQSGSAISVNFGTPTTTVIFAGFAASNDGFIDQNPASRASIAAR